LGSEIFTLEDRVEDLEKLVKELKDQLPKNEEIESLRDSINMFSECNCQCETCENYS
jgi:Tfp pilus assembly protein PilO